MPELSLPLHDPIRRLLTLTQAAHDLAVSRRTLERLIAARRFPAPLKIDRSSRVRPEDLASYLESLRRDRGAQPGRS